MDTITIEDPSAAVEAIKGEFPDMTMHAVWFAHDHTFIVSAWTRNPSGDLGNSIQGTGKNVEEAVAKFRDKAAKHNPLAVLESEAAKLGMKLVPANS